MVKLLDVDDEWYCISWNSATEHSEKLTDLATALIVLGQKRAEFQDAAIYYNTELSIKLEY